MSIQPHPTVNCCSDTTVISFSVIFAFSNMLTKNLVAAEPTLFQLLLENNKSLILVVIQAPADRLPLDVISCHCGREEEKLEECWFSCHQILCEHIRESKNY